MPVNPTVEKQGANAKKENVQIMGVIGWPGNVLALAPNQSMQLKPIAQKQAQDIQQLLVEILTFEDKIWLSDWQKVFNIW